MKKSTLLIAIILNLVVTSLAYSNDLTGMIFSNGNAYIKHCSNLQNKPFANLVVCSAVESNLLIASIAYVSAVKKVDIDKYKHFYDMNQLSAKDFRYLLIEYLRKHPERRPGYLAYISNAGSDHECSINYLS